MKHRATKRFWDLYAALPEEVRLLADKSFKLLKADAAHPSLRFKKVAKFWSARVGAAHRALRLPTAMALPGCGSAHTTSTTA